MNEKLLGHWKQLIGEVKKKWGELTDEELKEIAGNKDKLLGMLQEKYGWAKAQAEEELNQFWEEQKDNLKGISAKTSQALEEVCQEFTQSIKKAPLKSLAIAAGVGVILGWIMSK